jgi:hypothetical protein
MSDGYLTFAPLRWAKTSRPIVAHALSKPIIIVDQS